jgi:preprotein translocase subunit SecG
MLETFLSVIHVIVALFMIFVVLVQGGNQGGVSAALGGGSNAGSAFGASGATSLLGKLTYSAAVVFMFTTISLTIISGNAGKKGIADQLSNQSATGTPEMTAPTGEIPTPTGDAKAEQPENGTTKPEVSTPEGVTSPDANSPASPSSTDGQVSPGGETQGSEAPVEQKP